MRPQTFPFQGFGRGMNLRDKPDVVSAAEAIDALNVTFTDRGAIQQRGGYAKLTAAALTNRPSALEPFYKTDGTKQLLAGCGTRLEALSSTGSTVAAATGLTNAVWDFARFGKPNEEVAYAGNGTDTLRRWTGSEWQAPNATVDGVGGKAMPKASSICVQPFDNRLVCTGFTTVSGGPGGIESSPSHVYWSEPGEPQGYESLAYEQFTPGDGERIQAVIAWQEFTFVFKETKFFVVEDVSASEATEGRPEFIYRPVETGVGLAAPRAICAHPSGVYFMGRHGIYRTTGGAPVEVSGGIEPIWTGDPSPFYVGGTIAGAALTKCVATTWQDRIYFAFPTEAANDRTLIFDPDGGWWTLTDLPAAALAVFRPDDDDELVFALSSGGNYIARHSLAYTNDDGAPIETRWRSGWFDLGSPSVKKIRATEIWGSGIVEMGIDFDYNIDPSVATEIDMSGSTGSLFGEGVFGGEGYFGDKANALVPRQRRIAVRGTVFSVNFESNELDQPFSIHRLEHLVPNVRQPAEMKA